MCRLGKALRWHLEAAQDPRLADELADAGQLLASGKMAGGAPRLVCFMKHVDAETQADRPSLGSS